MSERGLLCVRRVVHEVVEGIGISSGSEGGDVGRNCLLFKSSIFVGYLRVFKWV